MAAGSRLGGRRPPRPPIARTLKVSAKVANLKRARPTADNIDEVDNVEQTQKEPNNTKKSQKQKNAEEVDRLYVQLTLQRMVDGSGGLLQCPSVRRKLGGHKGEGRGPRYIA